MSFLDSEVAQKQYETLPVDPFEQDRRNRLSQLDSHPQPTLEPTFASLSRVHPSFRVDLDGILGSRQTDHAALPSSPLDLLNAAAGRAAMSTGREALLRASGRRAISSVPTPPIDQRPRSSVQIASASAGSLAALSVNPDADFQPIIWEAGSYEIVLLMDHREKSGKRGEQGAIPLCEQGVRAETSNDMVLGDIMWVARRTDGGQEGGIESVVLDYIIERKRLDDLVSSIRDGRFREQKVSPRRQLTVITNLADE